MTLKPTEKKLAYTTARPDIINIIDHEPRKVLDVGCSDGSLGSALKNIYKNTEIHGVEFDPDFIKVARTRLSSVVQADLNNGALPSFPQEIDLFIFADVLEHTTNPKYLLTKILNECSNGSSDVIISLPNVQHITVIKNLLIGQWPERQRGIFDKTHLRWFTLKSIEQLAVHAELDVIRIDRKYRIVDKPSSIINKVAKIFKILPFRNFFTYQYVVLLRQKN